MRVILFIIHITSLSYLVIAARSRQITSFFPLFRPKKDDRSSYEKFAQGTIDKLKKIPDSKFLRKAYKSVKSAYNQLINYFDFSHRDMVESDSNHFMHLQRLTEDLAKQAGIPGYIQLYIVDENTVAYTGLGIPFVYNWVALSKRWAESKSLETLTAVLAHEIGHIKTFDVIKQFSREVVTDELQERYVKDPHMTAIVNTARPLVKYKLSRIDEFKADLFAAKLVGATPLISFFEDLNPRCV